MVLCGKPASSAIMHESNKGKERKMKGKVRRGEGRKELWIVKADSIF
jgi:hypothetical protein